jgi:UDP-N-acetyl-D-glucosamine dehydrogenase
MPGFRYTALSENILSWADCVIITTNHSDYDYDWIVKHAKLIVDTRNATRNVSNGCSKIYKL